MTTDNPRREPPELTVAKQLVHREDDDPLASLEFNVRMALYHSLGPRWIGHIYLTMAVAIVAAMPLVPVEEGEGNDE